MDSSQFTENQTHFDSLEQLETQGATCDTFRVKLYGKLHFLKRLKPEFVNDIRYQEAFRKEFETGYRLEHPHLVRYISLTDEGILMEYIDGETLSQRIARQPAYFKDKKNTDRILCQLLDVVSYLHSHQVLHLDLKPDNILLTRINDDVKLIDFGCCYTDTFVDTQGRTNRFAAPEQLAGEKPDVRTDIYAVGKILESLPYHQYYNKVISRSTAEHSADRYPSVDEMLHDIKRSHSYFRIVLSFVFAILLLGVVIVKSCQPYLTVKADPEVMNDTATLIENDTFTLIEKDTVVQPIVKQETPIQKKPQVSMKDDMDRMMDKAYRSTIASFCDSLFPSPNPQTGKAWADASTAFHQKTFQIASQLHKKFPDVPESSINQELESRFQNLVAFVFNKMRENGQQQ